MDKQFSLCWDNFAETMQSGLASLLHAEQLVDVTLAIDGRHLKAHKIVLSVCSPYFRHLFAQNPCKHPIVFMNGVEYEVMCQLLEFMYRGEVEVGEETLTGFIRTAEELQIKGLTRDESEPPPDLTPPSLYPPQHQQQQAKKRPQCYSTPSTTSATSQQQQQQAGKRVKLEYQEVIPTLTPIRRPSPAQQQQQQTMKSPALLNAAKVNQIPRNNDSQSQQQRKHDSTNTSTTIPMDDEEEEEEEQMGQIFNVVVNDEDEDDSQTISEFDETPLNQTQPIPRREIALTLHKKRRFSTPAITTSTVKKATIKRQVSGSKEQEHEDTEQVEIFYQQSEQNQREVVGEEEVETMVQEVDDGGGASVESEVKHHLNVLLLKPKHHPQVVRKKQMIVKKQQHQRKLQELSASRSGSKVVSVMTDEEEEEGETVIESEHSFQQLEEKPSQQEQEQQDEKPLVLLTPKERRQSVTPQRRKQEMPRYIVDGFVFHVNIIKGNPPMTYLRCLEYKRLGCLARAVIPFNGTINDIRLKKEHNHPPDFAAEEKIVFLRELKDLVQKNNPAKEVYNVLSQIYPNAARETSFDSIRSKLNRWKKLSISSASSSSPNVSANTTKLEIKQETTEQGTPRRTSSSDIDFSACQMSECKEKQ